MPSDLGTKISTGHILGILGIIGIFIWTPYFICFSVFQSKVADSKLVATNVNVSKDMNIHLKTQLHMSMDSLPNLNLIIWS